MKLFLIRHGRQCSKLCNVDVDLSEEGYRQASLLGERLFHENIQVVYSSNLPWKRLRQPISTGMWSISYGRS